MLPEESVQKVTVDSENNSYVIGFTYLEHNYTTDPNGSYKDHKKNYDIRLTKFDESGAMLWDKTYDTGNDDYGYAVTLSPDKQRIYIGGGAEVESGSQAWHDAVLLELDAGSGCPVGQHFQSSGRGTTSAYYDIEVNAENIYAVGELQINPNKPEEPFTNGGLINVFSKEENTGRETCAADLVIPDATAADLTLTNNLIREGDTPTVAYSVTLPPTTNCENCEVLIGGASGANGWIDSLNADNETLTPFMSPAAMTIQDIAVQNDQVIFVGSSIANDMIMLGYDRAGAPLPGWAPNPINIGPGRLRGLAIDDFGFIYTVGTNEAVGSVGHLFKYGIIFNEEENPELQMLKHLQSRPEIDVSVSDLALYESGGGVISGRVETEPNKYGGVQIQFNCPENCN